MNQYAWCLESRPPRPLSRASPPRAPASVFISENAFMNQFQKVDSPSDRQLISDITN